MKRILSFPHIALLYVLTCTLPSAADWCLFIIEKDPEWTSDERSYCFRMADGSLAPTGLYVQCLNAPLELALSPPTTNANYTPHPNSWYTLGHHTFVEWPSDGNYVLEYLSHERYMGVDFLNQGYPAGEGCIATDLDGDEDRYGWLRAFSYYTITGAAYYGDTEARPLNIFAEWYDYWDSTNFFITTVNPAYIIPGFSLATALTSLYDETIVAVSGHVDTVAGIDNNRLHDSVVTVHWWCVAVTNFRNNTTVTNSGVIPVFSGGTWTGQIELVRYQPFDAFGTTNTITFRAVGASPRPDFPRSPDIVIENIVTVPEPSIMVSAILFISAMWLIRAQPRRSARG